MGTNYAIRNGLIAALGVSGLVLSACAGHQGNRYASIYDFESGGDCGNACGTTYQPPVSDCGQTTYGGCAGSVPTITHVQPMPTTTYSSGTIGGSGYSSGGSYTTGGTISSGSYSTGGTISSGSYSSGGTISSGGYSTGGYSSFSSSTAPAECPAGTVMQPDNTCLQTSGSSFSGISSSAGSTGYTSTTTTTSIADAVTCPAGTMQQADGTCLQTGGASSSYTTTTTVVEPAPVTTTTHTGYGATTGYTATDYLPIRK